jgi:hypothetical protein
VYIRRRALSRGLGLSLSLDAKAAESLALVEACLRRKEYLTAAAGRAYYSVFQRIKHILETKGFDYRAFVSSIGLPNERPFSHGTIVPALRDYMIKTKGGVPLSDIQKLVPLDELYNVRRKSDYSAGYEVDPKSLKWCIDKASEILVMLQTF